MRPETSSSGGLTTREQAYRTRMGDRGYARFEALKKSERQRVWDNMRVIARQRFEEGIMPAWFKPEWLDIEEAPTNTWWRQHGLSAYRQDTSWLGENAPSTSSSGGSGSGGQSGGGGSGGGGGGSGWWREEDPYWPLRDWGDHPMRWWTWGLAGLLAVGGVCVHAQTSAPQAAHLGLGAAALLGLSAVAMSDIRDSALGELGVKAAWAICLLVSASDFTRQGLKPQQQQQGSWDSSSSSSLQSSSVNNSFRGTGWACFAMAVMYMWTGMSGLADYALPTNPGEAFKMADIAQRHKIWDYWGYGSATMRV